MSVGPHNRFLLENRGTKWERNFKQMMHITYLYILSIGVLERWSSPKGVLDVGRITPTETDEIQVNTAFQAKTGVIRSW